MELKEMIKVMNHYENGGEIEYSNKDEGNKMIDYDFKVKSPSQEVALKNGRNSSRKVQISSALYNWY